MSTYFCPVFSDEEIFPISFSFPNAKNQFIFPPVWKIEIILLISLGKSEMTRFYTSREKGRFLRPLVFGLSVSVPHKARPLCPTSLSVSRYGDPSLNSPAGLEGGWTDLIRDTQKQHKSPQQVFPLYDSVGLPLYLSYLLPATASAREGLTLTVYRKSL